MKAWYDDIDTATLQRIKTYSAFNDPESKNLMVQTMYEYRENEIQDFKETNHELALESIARQKRIAELEAENDDIYDALNTQSLKTSDLEAQIEKMKCCGNCENGELSAHEEPCRHCQRCFASKDVTDQENVKDNWEAIKEIKEK